MSGSIQSFRLKNFKAVRDSGEVKFTPLTAFIGNNGSGKSSLIEGLQTYQQILLNELDSAMNLWHGFESIHNPPIELLNNGLKSHKVIIPIEFEFIWVDNNYHLSMTLGMNSNSDEIFIESESLTDGNQIMLQRNQSGEVTISSNSVDIPPVPLVDMSPLPLGRSMITPVLIDHFRQKFFPPGIMSLSFILPEISNWQFLTLNPYSMGDPKPQKRTRGYIRLESDGSNIAEYLLDIQKRDQSVFDGIIETLRYVLPYANDLQPMLTSELERNVHLQLTEGKSKIPGWLLSSGTLRILAILAVLRHPQPPPLIVIEEIENGLDPNTIHVIVEEMRQVVESGTSQIILTTHSPYLLDLLSLSQIVVVERNQDGEPIFTRPADQPALEEWSKKFAPGKLYTSGTLNVVNRV